LQHKAIDRVLAEVKGWRAKWSVKKSFDLSAASQVGIFLLSVMLSKDILLQYMAYGQWVKMLILSGCNASVLNTV
jgi:hypothetical protein